MNYVEDVIEMLCSVHVEQIKINEVFQESGIVGESHTRIKDNRKIDKREEKHKHMSEQNSQANQYTNSFVSNLSKALRVVSIIEIQIDSSNSRIQCNAI